MSGSEQASHFGDEKSTHLEPHLEPIEEHRTPPAARSELIGQLLKTGLFALILFLLARLVVLPYEVDGQSMVPNLANQERVLVNRAVYSHFDPERLVGWVPGVSIDSSSWYPFHRPAIGDIVVLNPPIPSDAPYIKRIVAVAGDVVTVRDGAVIVNGTIQMEPYLRGVETTCEEPIWCDGYVVPSGAVYVMGDNRGDSFDSRSFGPVPIDNIIGKAWFSNWPIDRLGPL
ncbi:MAG TPA: signal peptidase I [Thermomicrobiales bacterium]|nr:signal peptidase I [Thermomicrobiales bacterium]